MIRVRKGEEVTESDEAWVSPLGSGILVNSCMNHADAETWSLLTNWYLAKETARPVDLKVISKFTHDDVSSFVGSLETCDRRDCEPGEVESVFDSFRGFRAGIDGSGQVLRYDPVVGDFAGWVKFKNHERVQIEIEIDVQWKPLPDAGLRYPPEASLPNDDDASVGGKQ